MERSNSLSWQVSQWYELVVFTASMEIYGSAVCERLDGNKGILKRRYYRQVIMNRTLQAELKNSRLQFIYCLYSHVRTLDLKLSLSHFTREYCF